jgi:dihydrofolate synthase/folylpolyglutamate synthase
MTRYAELLAWIYSFTNTERTGQFVRDREDNLRRERTLLAALGNPQRSYGVTHVAGTKGKGSTSAMIAAILRAAGVRTGLYSQPDLHTFRERMRVNGEVAPEDALVALEPALREAIARMPEQLRPLIMYEVATALAFLYFRAAHVQHAVIEVGLGGRLDATNVVEPLVTAITSISYDHMHVLGNTLSAIAGEKAGIIKESIPVVCSAQAPEALEKITQVAAERHAPLIRVGPDGCDGCAYTFAAGDATPDRQWFTLRTPTGLYRDLELALLGEHQVENAAAAVAVAETLRASLPQVDESAIRAGLRAVRWEARLQVVAREPWVVVDGAHNADSFARMFTALRRHFPFERLILVLGVMADKDLDGIVREIGQARVNDVIATAVDYPRAAPPETLAGLMRTHAPDTHVAPVATSGEALERAVQDAGPHDLICIAGSLYLAGEALRWLARQPWVIPGSIEIAGVDH